MAPGLDSGCIIAIITYLSPYMKLTYCMCHVGKLQSNFISGKDLRVVYYHYHILVVE